jgi:hypothetical protein
MQRDRSFKSSLSNRSLASYRKRIVARKYLLELVYMLMAIPVSVFLLNWKCFTVHLGVLLSNSSFYFYISVLFYIQGVLFDISVYYSTSHCCIWHICELLNISLLYLTYLWITLHLTVVFDISVNYSSSHCFISHLIVSSRCFHCFYLALSSFEIAKRINSSFHVWFTTSLYGKPFMLLNLYNWFSTECKFSNKQVFRCLILFQLS